MGNSNTVVAAILATALLIAVAGMIGIVWRYDMLAPQSDQPWVGVFVLDRITGTLRRCDMITGECQVYRDRK